MSRPVIDHVSILMAFILVLSLAVPAWAARGLKRVIKNSQGKQVGFYTGSYALVIGVSDYTQGWRDLPGVAEDVTLVQNALKKQGFEITVVNNPTRRELDDAFIQFISRYGLQPDHRVLIYFAGHGYTEPLAYGGDMGYIIPRDAPLPAEDKSGFSAKAIDMGQIKVYARRIQSKHALFLFDSCFSGSLMTRSSGIPPHISNKTALPVRQFITAGGKHEEVPDNSYFRQQFILALQGNADIDKDGYVTGTELGEFLYKEVVHYSNDTQHPQSGKLRDANLDKGDFVFPVNIPKPFKQDPPAHTQPISPDPEKEFYGLVQHSSDSNDLAAFLEAYPQSRYAPLVRFRLKQLEEQKQAALPPPPQSPRTELPNNREQPMIYVPPSKVAAVFRGKPWDRPIREFYIDPKPVTNQEFLAFVKSNPEWQKSRIPRSKHNGKYLQHWDGDTTIRAEALEQPVRYVSHYSAAAYCKSKGKLLTPSVNYYRAAADPLVPDSTVRVKYEKPYDPPDLHFMASEWTNRPWDSDLKKGRHKPVPYRYGVIHTPGQHRTPGQDRRYAAEDLGFRCIKQARRRSSRKY